MIKVMHVHGLEIYKSRHMTYNVILLVRIVDNNIIGQRIER